MSTSGPAEAMSRPIEVDGYAIVSDDDRIAGPDGLVPPSLRNEKDWDYYQNALADSDLIVFGHRSHELEPNVRGDRRLVISSRADRARATRRRLVVEPGAHELGGGRKKAAAARRPRGGARRPGRVRPLLEDRLRRISSDARARGEAARRASDFFRLRHGPLGRGRAHRGRLARPPNRSRSIPSMASR